MPTKKSSTFTVRAAGIVKAAAAGANVKDAARQLLHEEARAHKKTTLRPGVFKFLLNATKGFATRDDARQLNA